MINLPGLIKKGKVTMPNIMEYIKTHRRALSDLRRNHGLMDWMPDKIVIYSMCIEKVWQKTEI
jgi:hypothetical protein